MDDGRERELGKDAIRVVLGVQRLVAPPWLFGPLRMVLVEQREEPAVGRGPSRKFATDAVGIRCEMAHAPVPDHVRQAPLEVLGLRERSVATVEVAPDVRSANHAQIGMGREDREHQRRPTPVGTRDEDRPHRRCDLFGNERKRALVSAHTSTRRGSRSARARVPRARSSTASTRPAHGCDRVTDG